MTYKSLILDDLEGRYPRFSTKNWPYLENGDKYSLSNYSSLIESGTRPARLDCNQIIDLG